MNVLPSQIISIFAEALAYDSFEARASHVDRVCGEDSLLRAQVKSLLNAHHEAGHFLKGHDLPCDFADAIEEPKLETAGTTVGPYKLLEQIGEGGMGVVYMADQQFPVVRRVALKIIKPGMDTRKVIARFEAERQALAMEHPHMAKVLDAGATEAGRPYFVMELVKGIPITQYCDEHRFTPRQRLELFIPVCEAVQHAHQKGIIHRDLKPTNVLVADYDERPVVKIIDFGVAKAIDQRLTEKTMFTEFGQVVGTIEYMSPEQAKLNQLDVDTRSDIYSLGVLLYELLAGSTPFDRQLLHRAAFDEMLRIIREDEPPMPSTRLSKSGKLPAIAANRGFSILSAVGGIAGTFSSTTLPALSAGLSWSISYNPTNVQLSVVPGIPGDYNGNGTVDAADYVLWRKTLGQTGTGLAADGNGNNQIDSGDYLVWRAHFDQTAGSGSGANATSAVPEPATLALLIAGMLVTYSCRRARGRGITRHTSLRTSVAARRLGCSNVDLFHLQHRIERALCSSATGIGDCFRKGNRRNLPGQSPFVLAPAARPLLAAVVDDRVPVAVRFGLVIGCDLNRERFVVLERRSAVEPKARNAHHSELDGQHVPFLPRRKVEKVIDLMAKK